MSSAIALLLTITLSHLLLADGFIVKMETRNLPIANQILLQCLDGGSLLATTNLGLNRTVLIDGTVTEDVFTDFITPNPGEISFDITPKTEGNFTCINKDTDTRSTNSLTLVASPTLDPDFTIGSTVNAQLGSNATIPCSLQDGVLIEYYSVEWYRGTSLIPTSSSQYEVSPDLSLIILNATQLDASTSYYCKLTVQEPIMDITYSHYGLDIGLKIYGDLVINPMSDVVVMEGVSSVMFSCTIYSAPAGYVRWLVNGTQIPSDDIKFTVETEETDVTSNYSIVSSNLTISDPTPSDSGTIQCIGYTENGVSTLVVSDQTTLTILSDNVTITYETTPTGSFSLKLSSPGIIPQVFTINLRLTSGSNVFDLMLADPSFYNTAFIDHFEVSRSLLPASFTSFTISAAIGVQDLMGAYTTPSNMIALPISSLSSTSSLATLTSTATPTTQPVSNATPTPTSTTTTVTKYTMSMGPSSSSVVGCPACTTCVSVNPLIAIIVILVILLVAMLAVLIGVLLYHLVSKLRAKPCPQGETYQQDKDNHVELHVVNPYSASTTPTHTSTSCSHDSHTQSPCSYDDSHAYSSADDESRSHSYTPSRPSSQESYYPDRKHHGPTATPSPLPHIYENDESIKFKRKLDMSQSETHRTTSSIAVGTSPPRDGKEIIIPAFIKGQSESPRRTEDRFTGGVLSPARSDPSLESSVKSDYNKRGFSETIAIPTTQTPKAEHTYTSPTEARNNPAHLTLQQFMYGNRKPPMKPKEEPKKEDEKIYQKIIKEYDVV